MTTLRKQILITPCPWCERRTLIWDNGEEIDAPPGWGCTNCGTAALAKSPQQAVTQIHNGEWQRQ